MKLQVLLNTSLLSLGLILSGCGNSDASTNSHGTDDKDILTIYTTIYPLEDFTKKIGGSYVEVKSIYPPNVDAHSFEPSAKDMIKMANSDLFIHTGVGIDEFAEKAAKSLDKEGVAILDAGVGIDLLTSTHEEHHHDEENLETDNHDEHSSENAEDHEHEGESAETEAHEEHEGEKNDEKAHNHGDYDPHIWLDPIRSIELANNIKTSLSKLMPEQEAVFESNFNQLKNDLEELDQEFQTTIAKSNSKYLLVAHAAYGYWESRYGIEQIAIGGLSPTQEPTQKELQRIIEESTEHGIHYIIFEQNVEPKVAKIIQVEIGANPLSLHNLESITEENIKQQDDYFSIMRKNLETIKTALNE
jgi:zinc transport system substrate-binding protein